MAAKPKMNQVSQQHKSDPKQTNDETKSTAAKHSSEQQARTKPRGEKTIRKRGHLGGLRFQKVFSAATSKEGLGGKQGDHLISEERLRS